MAQELCEICHRRPATTEVTVVENGQQKEMHICDYDYRRLSKRGRSESPLESLFGSSNFFDEFFNGDFPSFGNMGRGFEAPANRSRESIDLVDYLSEHSKELLHKAAEHAVQGGRQEVDTEHVLLALTESDVVQAIFKEFKVSADDLKQYLLHNIPEAGKKAKGKEAAEMDVSPRVKGVLERAFHISRELGHSYIGPEHMLTALIEEGEGIAADVLQKYGLTKNALRQKALKVVGKSGAEAGKVTSHTVTPNLDKFSRDLTEYARQGRLDPVIGRAKEIETTIEVLARRKKNNPVLIGEPGVGKTAIVEGLAQRIVQDEVPEVLRNKRLVELNVNSMVAGAKYRGELEERTKQILDEVVAHSNDLIIFIDEIHTIVGAGQGGEGGLDIANVFKPALARGELHLIGATTLNEYQKHIEKDAALERRFQPVYVGEPSVQDTIEILRGLRDRFEAHHKVRITSSAIEAAAKLSDRYIRGRHLPDKAIDLIDQAAARVRINSSSRPAEIHELESRIKKLKQEQESASASKRYDRAREIESRLKEANEKLDTLKADWKKSVGTSSSEVTPLHVASIVATLTGIPVSDLTTEDRDKLLKLEDRLQEHVVGQPQAVKSVAQVVKLARTAMREPNHPIATFLFLGPTGVGKTELSKALARELFGDESALIRIDMSEYMERHTVARLIGAPPGYVGFEEGGQLTEKVRRRPYSVVLLDEIEKAHPEVHNVLLQLFDEGRLTDGKGRVVDFTNTMIIATSNIGSDLIQSNMTAAADERLEYNELKSKLMDVLRRHFRPEMLNRIDEVIVFNALGKQELRGIVRIQLERVKKNVAAQGIGLEFDDSLLDYLAEVGFAPEWGARELKRKIRTELETRLADALLKDELKKGDRATISYDPAAGITIKTKPAPKEEKAKHVEPKAKKKSSDQARPSHH